MEYNYDKARDADNIIKGMCIMKKALVLLMAFVMTISMVSSSYAVVYYYNKDSISSYTGVWYSSYNNKDGNNVITTLSIGYDTKYEVCTAVRTVYVNDSNNGIYSLVYQLTLDEDCLYLCALTTELRESIAFKAKLEDGKLKLYELDGDSYIIAEDNIMTYEKLQ